MAFPAVVVLPTLCLSVSGVRVDLSVSHPLAGGEVFVGHLCSIVVDIVSIRRNVIHVRWTFGQHGDEWSWRL